MLIDNLMLSDVLVTGEMGTYLGAKGISEGPL